MRGRCQDRKGYQTEILGQDGRGMPRRGDGDTEDQFTSSWHRDHAV